MICPLSIEGRYTGTMAKLNDIMEFDHVIEVRPDGEIVGRSDIYAPSLYWVDDDQGHELEDKGWALLDGFSGQYRYGGPIMHASELIGGAIEDEIRENPGVYVALVCYCIDDSEDVAGWAIARKDDA